MTVDLRSESNSLLLMLLVDPAIIRVRVQLIRHLKPCTNDIHLHNECAHVGLSIHAPVHLIWTAVRSDLHAATVDVTSEAIVHALTNQCDLRP